MGYYCTVPQCTSLAGKTKNVKFHRFPRDVTMADKWNNILRRGKPYTKYSKVCSLHFTQADYNVTTMGQWKTLSKDAVPSQNLPRLNSDGSVMVIRKSRTVKYREGRTDRSEKEKWALPIGQNTHGGVCVLSEQDANISYRLQALSTIASSLPPSTVKPKKQDAIMQTDPVETKSDDEDSQPDNSYNEGYLAPYSFKSKTEITDKPYLPETKFEDKYEAKDYTKTEDYIPQTNEEYNKEAEKYALERKALNGYDKDGNNGPSSYSKLMDNGYKLPAYPPYPRDFPPAPFAYDELRAQQNLQALQDQQRILENQNMFSDSPIKQEVEINEGDKYMYDRNKEQLECSPLPFQRLPDPLELHVKQEPDVSCDTVMPPQESPYYTNGHSNLPGAYPYEPPRPGPELLIAKQNALAAHTQLWQNSMKRPFFYSESPHYSSPPLLHRYANEDIPRILQ